MSRPRDPTTTMSAPSSSVIWMMAGPGCRLAEPANLNRICRQDRNVASVLRIRNDQWESTLGHRQLTPQCLAWCWRFRSPKYFDPMVGLGEPRTGGRCNWRFFVQHEVGSFWRIWMDVDETEGFWKATNAHPQWHCLSQR